MLAAGVGWFCPYRVILLSPRAVAHPAIAAAPGTVPGLAPFLVRLLQEPGHHEVPPGCLYTRLRSSGARQWVLLAVTAGWATLAGCMQKT